MTSISVAMTTFNGERFLSEQLESLSRQTRPPDELVVVDDGSTDSTVSIVESFSQAAAFPVRLYRNESRLGWRGNFMKAASLCQSDLIAFCDQDDVWYSQKIEVVTSLFLSPDILLAYHNADLVDEAGRVHGQLRSLEIDRPVSPPRARPTIWSNPLGLTQTFRRSLLAFHPFWEKSRDPRNLQMPAAHDQWIYYLASNLGSVSYSPACLLAYRQHGKNAVGYSLNYSQIAKPFGWDTSLDPYIEMLSRFCDILHEAQGADLVCFQSALETAEELNRRFLTSLQANRMAHLDPSLARRFRHLANLLRQNAFARTTQWSLGRKALLKALFIGLPLGG